MNDQKINIQFLKDRIEKFVKERDWDQFHHPKELAISLNIEAGELLELFQWKEKEPLEKLLRYVKPLY